MTQVSTRLAGDLFFRTASWPNSHYVKHLTRQFWFASVRFAVRPKV